MVKHSGVSNALVPSNDMPDAHRLPIGLSEVYASLPIGTSSNVIMCGLQVQKSHYVEYFGEVHTLKLHLCMGAGVTVLT